MRDYERFSSADGEFTSVPKEYADLCRLVDDVARAVGEVEVDGYGRIPAGELADRIEQLNSA